MGKIRKIILIFGILLLSTFLVLANGDHKSELEEGKKIVESGIGCDKLTDEQLEAIGEYYMEQMHPGESHDLMHKMMGIEEGTEYHKQFHVNMARTMYCGETNAFGHTGMMGGGMMGSGGMMGMMPMMMNMMGGNMMGSGMIGNNPMGFGGFGYGYWGLWDIVWLLFWVGIIILVFWLIYKFIIQKRTENPLEILKKRFAKGEITKKQFEEIKKEIGE